MKATPSDAAIDHIGSDIEATQLPASDHAVLELSKLGDHPIGTWAGLTAHIAAKTAQVDHAGKVDGQNVTVQRPG